MLCVLRDAIMGAATACIIVRGSVLPKFDISNLKNKLLAGQYLLAVFMIVRGSVSDHNSKKKKKNGRGRPE